MEYEEIKQIPYKSIIKLIDKFIINLREDHELPGNTYFQLIDIGQWGREHHHLTDDQKFLVIRKLEEYEDQLDPFKIY